MKDQKAGVFYLMQIGQISGVCALIVWLFYNSLAGALIILPYFVYRVSRIGADYKAYRNSILIKQFKDFLSDLETGLMAGSSPSIAIVNAKEDIDNMYGAGSPISESLNELVNRLNCNESLESALESMAKKSKTKEIEDFCEIFIVALESGGDMVGLVRTARDNIYETININREIEEIISANRTECLVMKGMPLLILLYFRAFSISFLAPLYYTKIGKLVMIILSIIYCLMIEYSEKIVKDITG